MAEVRTRLQRAQRNHRISIAVLVLLLIAFLATSLLFGSAGAAQSTLLVLIGIAGLALAITTMVVMINKYPDAEPDGAPVKQ